MITLKNKLIRRFTNQPKSLFLVDSFGAIITALFLYAILRPFHESFGMPPTVLTRLTLIVLCFWIYSTSCFLFLKGSWPRFIRIIALANLFYCVLTIRLMIANHHLLTTMGVSYFLIEIAVICALSYIEFNVATKIERE